jgi:hypothetical protein
MNIALAAGSLNGPGTYLTWGWLGISVTNLVIMLATIAVFVVALLVPFSQDDEEDERWRTVISRSWNVGSRR